MTAIGLTDTDISMKDAVMRQLEWDPEVDATAIGVTAKNGAVTLTGYINSYVGKLAAERAAKRVRGVRAVANDVEVRLKLERMDTDIAADVVRAMELCGTIPETVQAAVHHGHVTLTGKVDWMFEKRQAEKVVRHLRGVRDVTNYIAIAPQAVARDVRHRIVEALHRNANLDSRNITVSVAGDTALLTVRSEPGFSANPQSGPRLMHRGLPESTIGSPLNRVATLTNSVDRSTTRGRVRRARPQPMQRHLWRDVGASIDAGAEAG